MFVLVMVVSLLFDLVGLSLADDETAVLSEFADRLKSSTSRKGVLLRYGCEFRIDLQSPPRVGTRSYV